MNFDVSFCNSCSGKMIKVAFLVSTDSVKYDKSFIANFLLSPKMKDLWKSANICQSYEWILSLVFFMTHIVMMYTSTYEFMTLWSDILCCFNWHCPYTVAAMLSTYKVQHDSSITAVHLFQMIDSLQGLPSYNLCYVFLTAV